MIRELDLNIKDRDPGDSMDGDVPYKDTLTFDVPTLGREAVQNVLDANATMAGPAEVVFRIRRLEGDELEQFEECVDWQAYDEHLERFRDADTSMRVGDFLDDLRDRRRLDVLVVEDRNTHGLYGGEIEDGTPYNALVRDSKFTEKNDDTSGGSHGVGKFVNYGLSLPSMVLFYSDLAGNLLDRDLEADDVETQVDESPRLVGRGLLPDFRRQCDDRILDGEEIWFGSYEDDAATDRPVSLWGEDARETAAQLGLERPDIPGTSVAIVGFGQPNGRIPPDLDGTAEELKRAVAYFFWPALEMGHLEVGVERPGGEIEEVTVDSAVHDYAPEIEPFVETFRQYQEADEELGEPGDVARTTIEFQFHPKGDSEVDGTANVGVRVPTAADLEHTDVLNHVALFRGRGMVVDYLRKDSLASRGQDFHAILATGKARPWPDEDYTEEDEEVDKFLRASEPAEHDEWDNQPKLQRNYKRSCSPAGTVRAIQGDYLKEALVPLIKTNDENEGDLVPAVSALFDLGVDGPASKDPETGLVDREVIDREFDREQRRWVYEAEIGPTLEAHGDWDADLYLRPKGEDNKKAGDVDVANVEILEPIGSSRVTGTRETKDRSNGSELRYGHVDGDASYSEATVRVTSEQLPSVNPRTGDIGAVSLGVTGDVDDPEQDGTDSPGGGD